MLGGGGNLKMISVIPFNHQYSFWKVICTAQNSTPLKNKTKTTLAAKSFDIAKTPDF